MASHIVIKYDGPNSANYPTNYIYATAVEAERFSDQIPLASRLPAISNPDEKFSSALAILTVGLPITKGLNVAARQ
jgi:hypothetical protein